MIDPIESLDKQAQEIELAMVGELRGGQSGVSRCMIGERCENIRTTLAVADVAARKMWCDDNTKRFTREELGRQSQAYYDMTRQKVTQALTEAKAETAALRQHLEKKALPARPKTTYSHEAAAQGIARIDARDDLAHETDRVARKLTAGAHLIMTQPVYELETWRAFVRVYEERHGPIGVPVMLGILPLQSHRHTEFLYNEVPGIRPTEAIRERMRLAGSNGRREGVRISQELLLEARDEVHGVYIMPSFHRYEVAAEVLEVVSDRRLTATLPGSA